MKKTIYEKITKKYQKPLMKSLKEFVAIDSTYDEQSKNEFNPFGEGVTKALHYIANLAKRDGFEVNNYDNMVVEIIHGEGDKNLTIMAHADVVPAGSDWEHDPFELVEKGGILSARGVADDKGPLLATYYAMKALRDVGKLNGFKIRFLVGGNEESGSLGMIHYFHELKKEQPTLGFSPDSDFPLIFAEKGIINFEITHKVEIPGLISIKGGVARNAVIEKCEVKFELNNEFLNYIMDHYHRNEAKIVTIDDVTTVTFLGKAAHGSTPELGKNAGIEAIKALAGFTKNSYLTQVVKQFDNLDGSGFKCANTSKDMGHNSSNVGLVSLRNGEFNLSCNFRYVNSADPKELISKIKENCKPFAVKIIDEVPVLYYPKDTVLIKTLLKAYQDETGDYTSEPLAIGGGTYAKEADNVVAFGMQFPGWDSGMHSNKEITKKEDLFKAMAVYARAIIDLGEELKK